MTRMQRIRRIASSADDSLLQEQTAVFFFLCQKSSRQQEASALIRCIRVIRVATLNLDAGSTMPAVRQCLTWRRRT